MGLVSQSAVVMYHDHLGEWCAEKMHYFKKQESGLKQIYAIRKLKSLMMYADFRVVPICTAV